MMVLVKSAGIQEAAVKDVSRNEAWRVNEAPFSRHSARDSHHFLKFVKFLVTTCNGHVDFLEFR